MSESITIPLTQGRKATIDAADWPLVAAMRWHAVPPRQGKRAWYARGALPRMNGKRKLVYMHRLILVIPAGVEVDHIDGNGLNNRRSNLRIATRSQNACNSGLRADNSTGFKGVYWHKRRERWVAQIYQDGKQWRIGFFSSPEEAALAYDQAALELHGPFARLNFSEKVTA